MEEYTDETLIQQALDGDKAAFDALVDRYRHKVHILAFRKLGDFHEAEDAVQETFLRAHQKLPTLKDRSKFAGWLNAITVNCCRMALRRRKSQKTEVIPLDELKHEQIGQLSIATHAGGSENQLLDEAIESLPVSARRPLELYYMEEN